MEPSPPPLLTGKGSGQRAGVGEVWGVEWDQLVTSVRKNVPVCSVGPLSPRSAPHSHQRRGPLCVHLPDPRAEATDEHTATSPPPPHLAAAAVAIISHRSCRFSLSNVSALKKASLKSCFTQESFLSPASLFASMLAKC